jgi:hypothetical protein
MVQWWPDYKRGMECNNLCILIGLQELYDGLLLKTLTQHISRQSLVRLVITKVLLRVIWVIVPLEIGSNYGGKA